MSSDEGGRYVGQKTRSELAKPVKKIKPTVVTDELTCSRTSV